LATYVLIRNRDKEVDSMTQELLLGTEKSIGTQLGCLTYSAYLLSLDGKMGSNPIVSLDANSQIAFVLHHVLGYKLEEAALLLEMSATEFCVQLQRAYLQLVSHRMRPDVHISVLSEPALA
jgi:hypothetical protein